jgi:hypothetical protein
MTELVPVKANTCRVCGQPGAVHKDGAVVRQRTYCVRHWSEYVVARKQAKNERERALRAAARREAEDAAVPQGWTPAETRQLPDGITRIVIHKQTRTVVTQRGAYQRETQLLHDWQPIARFFLSTGYRLYNERAGVLVLERVTA